jgi:hypothetical protein
MERHYVDGYTSKIFSCITNARLFKILDKHGAKFEFGGTLNLECADGLFTPKTPLSLRMNHNLPTFTGFSDLVKAYNTTDHKLLIKVLEQYGAPPRFCSAVECMYIDVPVVLKLGKSIAEISQSFGFREGDNMAPVLLIIPTIALFITCTFQLFYKVLAVYNFFQKKSKY